MLKTKMGKVSLNLINLAEGRNMVLSKAPVQQGRAIPPMALAEMPFLLIYSGTGFPPLPQHTVPQIKLLGTAGANSNHPRRVC